MRLIEKNEQLVGIGERLIVMTYFLGSLIK